MNLFRTKKSLPEIWDNPNLARSERLILHWITSRQNLKADVEEVKPVSLQTIAKVCCYSPRTIRRHISSLISRGYLVRCDIFSEDGQRASKYQITGKIFEDFMPK